MRDEEKRDNVKCCCGTKNWEWELQNNWSRMRPVHFSLVQNGIVPTWKCGLVQRFVIAH